MALSLIRDYKSILYHFDTLTTFLKGSVWVADTIEIVSLGDIDEDDVS